MPYVVGGDVFLSSSNSLNFTVRALFETKYLYLSTTVQIAMFPTSPAVSQNSITDVEYKELPHYRGKCNIKSEDVKFGSHPCLVKVVLLQTISSPP